MDPRSVNVDPLPISKGTLQGSPDPAIASVREPFPAVIVVLDQSFVLFPSDTADLAFHARAVHQLSQGGGVNFRGEQVPWPRYATYRFDR